MELYFLELYELIFGDLGWHLYECDSFVIVRNLPNLGILITSRCSWLII